MIVLAIETSGNVCGAAVAIDGALVSSSEIIRDAAHDAFLPEVVNSAIRFADVSMEKIDIVAISAGPGSFTGLRIGASFVKGLAFGGTPRILPVPTLTSLHVAAREVALLSGAQTITSIIPSHRDLYYVVQAPCSDVVHEQAVSVCTAADVEARIAPETFVVGPGAKHFTPTPVSGLTRLSARFVAFASWHMLEAGVPCVDVDAFVPQYQQDFIPR
jgi:tRNA threonylcarbamoyl adenosine modification protein YeaZ